MFLLYIGILLVLRIFTWTFVSTCSRDPPRIAMDRDGGGRVRGDEPLRREGLVREHAVGGPAGFFSGLHSAALRFSVEAIPVPSRHSRGSLFLHQELETYDTKRE